MEARITVGTADIPAKGKKQTRVNLKEYIVDEWRAMGFNKVRIVREGVRVIIEPIEDNPARTG